MNRSAVRMTAAGPILVNTRRNQTSATGHADTPKVNRRHRVARSARRGLLRDLHARQISGQPAGGDVGSSVDAEPCGPDLEHRLRQHAKPDVAAAGPIAAAVPEVVDAVEVGADVTRRIGGAAATTAKVVAIRILGCAAEGRRGIQPAGFLGAAQS